MREMRESRFSRAARAMPVELESPILSELEFSPLFELESPVEPMAVELPAPFKRG